MMELYLHSPMCIHGLMLNYIIKYWGNFTYPHVVANIVAVCWFILCYGAFLNGVLDSIHTSSVISLKNYLSG
jgi:hypothetical protein